MFDRIAGVYDAMNTVMTVGLHRQWRARAAEEAALRPGDRALDVACGTGDFALERLAGDPAAYAYLPTSVKRFPDPEALARLLWSCGLRQVRWLLTAGGIIAIHVGEVGA